MLKAIEIFSYFVLGYFVLLQFTYFLLLLFAAGNLFYFRKRKTFRLCRPGRSLALPDIAMFVPAYNEEATIAESISTLLKMKYPALEVIVVNDGSSDKTLRTLVEHFHLFPVPRTADYENLLPLKGRMLGIYRASADPRITVIDKENGGKADSLNAALNYSRSRLFCAVDADTLIEDEALLKLAHAWLERDAKIVGLGGIIRIANGSVIEGGRVIEARMPKRFLPGIQVVEYIRAFLIGRAGWSALNALPVISGAFGLFERKSVLKSGGYRTDIVGEDMELVLRLHRMMKKEKKPYKIGFMPDPVAWTQAPEKWRMLGKQRDRWQRGLAESLWIHKGMLFNPRYSLTGLLALPYQLLFELLGPVIELVGIITVAISYAFGWLDAGFALLFFIVALLYGAVLTVMAIILEEFTMKRYERPRDIAKLLWYAFLEIFGYRQLNSWWRLKGLVKFLLKQKSWGVQERKAFDSEP